MEGAPNFQRLTDMLIKTPLANLFAKMVAITATEMFDLGQARKLLDSTSPF